MGKVEKNHGSKKSKAIEVRNQNIVNVGKHLFGLRDYFIRPRGK